MSSDSARTPGVSPAQIEKALDEANREIFALTGAGIATMAAVSAALRNLIRAAQVEALESVDHGVIDPLKTAWAVREALARLRQSASAPKETE